MTALKTYIDGLLHPVFLVEFSSDKILFANETASKQVNFDKKSDYKIDEVLSFFTDPSGRKITQLNGQWYQIKTQTFDHNEVPYQILELLDIEGVPNTGTIEYWKDLIAVMLHRLRSPLTGISGYLDLLEDEVHDIKHQPRFDIIQKGFANVFDIMDELEILYTISPDYDDSDFSTVSIHKAIDRILFDLSPEQKERISFDNSILEAPELNTNSDLLHEILFQLLENALLHSDDDQIEVFYLPENNGRITIKNKASSIDHTFKKKMFDPFVTTRATNLGIGLTKAQLYALQIGCLILFNEEDNSFLFSLKTPLIQQ